MFVIIVQLRENMELEQIANWIITRPGLIQGDSVIVGKAPFSHSQLSFNNDYQGNPFLGFIYQHVCAELFNSSPNYQLLAEEIQLIQDKETIGAIDFIAKNNQTRNIEQWEVAIKFFLLHKGLWYGPNPQDRLDKKLDRMLNHQLIMSQTQLFKTTYPQWSDKAILPKLLMQGRLYVNPFRPETIPEHCLGLPINKNRIKGYWCYQDEISKIPDAIYPLEKWQWMTGNSENREQPVQIEGRFTHGQTQNGTFWFIVPSHWPNKK